MFSFFSTTKNDNKKPGKFPSFTTSDPDLEQGVPPPSRVPTLGRRRSSFDLRALGNQSSPFRDLERGPGTPISPRAISPITRDRPIPPTQTPIKYPPESPLPLREKGQLHNPSTPGTQFTPNDMIITMLLDETERSDIPAYEKRLQADPAFLIQEVENYLTNFGSIPPSQGLQEQIMTALEFYQENFDDLPPKAEEELRKYLDPENKRLFPMNGGKSRKGRNGKKSKNRKKSRKGKKSKTKKSKTNKSKKSRKN